MYAYLKGYCPQSYEIKNATDLKENLRLFDENSYVVLKPANGLKGIGVSIDYPANIAKLKNIDFSAPWILQEFVDTSHGISGLVSGDHDLRVVIANGKILFSHIRQPQAGSKIANYSRFGFPCGRYGNFAI